MSGPGSGVARVAVKAVAGKGSGVMLGDRLVTHPGAGGVSQYIVYGAPGW